MERQVSIRLPARVLREVDRRARRQRCRRSDVFRTALAAYLDLADSRLGEPLGALIPHLIGCVKGTPPDLASNPRRYMKDFGRGR